MTRPVVVHYHLFKNAGTSLDAALRNYFGDRWATIESDAAGRLLPHQLAAFIHSAPSAQVVSSHTAVLPTPTIVGVHVIPVLFLREPIGRVWSSYGYERSQVEDTPGAIVARASTFAEYVTQRLDAGGAIANFQTRRLALAGEGTTMLDRAMDGLRKLAFVGIVEDFEGSLARLERLLTPHFPDINLVATRANAGRLERPDIRLQLGDSLYHRLIQANLDDAALWQEATRMQSYSESEQQQ